MAEVDIIEQVRQRFSAPLADHARRRIVVWHDPQGEFADEFSALAGEAGIAFADDGLPGGAVRCLEIKDGNTFASKRRIAREAADSNFLLYRRRARGSLEGDWLADVELYADHFQADYVSLLLNDLKAPDTLEMRQIAAQLKPFFASKERTGRYKALVEQAHSREQLVMGVFAATLHAAAPTVEAVVRVYAMALLDERGELGGFAESGGSRDGADPSGSAAPLAPKPLADLAKYGAEDLFAGFIKAKIGYEGDLADANALFAHLLLSALSATMPADALSGLERYIAPGNAQFCLGIFREWAEGGEDARRCLHDICRSVEERLLLPQRFATLPLDALVDSDVFPAIDEAILLQFMTSVAAGADRGEEVAQTLQVRREMQWRDCVAPFFDCLAAAVQMGDFKRSHAQGFHETDAKRAWEAYTQDWWRMDAAYRAFCNAYRLCVREGSAALDEPAHELAQTMDNLYANWFLASSNACWVSAAADAWERAGYVSGVGVQRRFYDDYVSAELSGGAKRVVVAISDALRFEVAQEIAARLDRAMRGTSKMEAVQATFPSETKFGMAALLPQSKLALSEADGEVYADGIPTRGTVARQAVLQARRPKSAAIQYADLVALSAAERKSFAADKEVIYVYHNTIDAAGHGEQTGQDVFDACSDAVADMASLVRIAVNNMGTSRVIITADHGFLHTRGDIPESQLASREEVSGEVVDVERRFLRAGAGATSGVFVNMRMDDIDGGSYTWFSPRECVRIKAPGSRNFVHGGVSLQELCVPVLRYRDARAGAKGYEERTKAELKLLSTVRRITSMLFKVELYQPEAVGGKILPAEYTLAMVDEMGNEVSEVRRAHADMESAEEKARIIRLQFGLKAGRVYDAKHTYYLLCRSKDTGQVAWKETYQIDIAFAPMDDFGF